MANYKYHNYTNLLITSTKKPFSTHLWWDHSTYGILMVDSTNQAVLLFSTIARLLVSGSDWDVVDLNDNTYSYNIQAGWLDGNDLWIVMCDNPGTRFEVCYIELDDSNDCNPIAVSSVYDTTSVYAHDILKHDTDFYAFISYRSSGSPKTDLFTVTGSPFVIKKAFDTETYDKTFQFVVSGDDLFTIMNGFFLSSDDNALNGSNGDAKGLCWDGTYFYVVNGVDVKVFKYNSSWVYQSTIDIYANGQSLPRDVCWDGTYFYVAEDDEANVYKYNSSWVYQSKHALNAGNTNSKGITWDGTYFYIVDSDLNVYKYNSSWTYQTSYNLDALNAEPSGLEWDGTYFYIVDNDDGVLYKYTSSFVLRQSYNFTALNADTIGVCTDGNFFYITDYIDDKVYVYAGDYIIEAEYDIDTDTLSTNNIDVEAIYRIPDELNRRGIAYDGNDIIFYTLQKRTDSLYYLQSYVISTTTNTEVGEHNISLMADRNTNPSANPPNNLEKGFHLTDKKVYQIPINYSGNLNLISSFGFLDDIIGITVHYVMDDSGNIYEYEDQITHILNGMLYHSRQNYPYLKMSFDSHYISIVPNQFVQIIGSYTADGSTSSDEVVFEGKAEKPTEGVVQYVTIINQGNEMDERKPNGSKAGRSDQIITDINNDGAPSGPEYIRDGTLSVGAAMGTLVFNKSKVLRKVYNEFAEHDGFTWALRPQGDLDYNAGGVDSGADIRYDGSTYFDSILQLKAWKVAKLNQIIVNGAINTATGILYTGQWNDVIGQQENGINSITVEDAQLNSDALCQAKADNMGAGETERTRARFKFRKTTYGFIQPGQTITFKYVVANYMTIAEAQFILDKIIMNIKSEVGYAEISSEL